MKLQLKRDKVISVVKGRDLVGVYVDIKKGNNIFMLDNNENKVSSFEILLAEMSPTKADKIIKIWNAK